MPLRRRRRRGMRYSSAARQQPRVNGLADNVLTVRTVIVVQHYDYIIDLVLHQNAVIEVVCAISGALGTHYYFGHTEHDSGYQVINLLFTHF